jgi:hypothetical protein
MDTSRAEQQAGVNVSYENSFTAIKRDILRETVEKNQKKIKANLTPTLPIETIEEKPMGALTGRSKPNSTSTKVGGSNKSKDNSSINEYLGKGHTSSAIKNAVIRPKT